MRSSCRRHPFAFPRRIAVLALSCFAFGALMLTVSLYLHRKTLDDLRISFRDENIVKQLQDGYVGFWGEQRLATATASDADFEGALRNLTDLIPDEVRVGRLLSPIDYSEGTSMLRDLAIRTRYFGVLFTAWESLHIVPSAAPGDMLIRQNIVERIRRSSFNDRSEAIQKYDTVRSFVNRLSRHLFPWTIGHSADHMLLHASFATGGRGIVMAVGDRQVAYVLTSINTFREFGCHLPVEVFFMGDIDLHEGSRAALAKLPGVTTRDLSKMVYDDDWTLKGRSRILIARFDLIS
jgi:alpha 1,3-mannosyltransferase